MLMPNCSVSAYENDISNKTDEIISGAAITVDDEETLNKVFEIFKEKFKDEFNFLED